MRRICSVLLSFALLFPAWSRRDSPAPIFETSTPAKSTQAPAEGALISAADGGALVIPYTKKRRLSYAGYLITIEHKRVNVEGFSPDNEVAVVKKNGRILGVFDAVRNPLGAFTRLALVSLLGDREKQLVIEQTGPREWAHWIVALKPRFHVVFDNLHYPVDHELGIEDRDGDGVPEVLTTLSTFWFFDGLCGACSPRFTIAFKYDRQRSVFWPANHLVKGLCDSRDELIEAERKIKAWQRKNPDYGSDPIKASDLYSKVLIHSLPLIYCGNGSLGWSFFDRLYNLPDRAVRKLRIKRALRSDRVFRLIQNDLTRTRRDASLYRARLSD